MKLNLEGRVLKVGAVAGALVATASAITYFNLPMPAMKHDVARAEEMWLGQFKKAADALVEINCEIVEDKEETLTRRLKTDRREQFDIQQQISQYEQENIPVPEPLVEQKIFIDEEVERQQQERQAIRDADCKEVIKDGD